MSSARTASSDSPRRLRVLEVVHAFPPRSFAGTELYTHHLARALTAQGHTVHVLYPVFEPGRAPLEVTRGHWNGVDVIELWRGGAARPGEFWNRELDPVLAGLLRDGGYDVVHFQHLANLSASWLEVARDAGVPSVLKVDDMYLYCARHHLVDGDLQYCAAGPESVDKCARCCHGPRAGRAERDALAQRFELLRGAAFEATAVHCASHFVRADGLRHGALPDSAEVIHTGIEPFDVAPRVPGSGRVRVGYLGAIHARKGVRVLLEAIRRVRARMPDAPLEFALRGYAADDRALVAELEALVRQGAVHWGGPFSPADRTEIFAGLDVLVAPSLGENYPFVLREALHAGVPVIATRIAGVPEIVREGLNGFLVPPGDPSALASLFLRIAADPACLGRLRPGSAPVKTIAEEAREIARLFARVCGRGPAAAIDALMKEGAYARAQELLEAELVSCGPSAPLLLRLGVAAFRQGKLERAFDVLTQAAAYAPVDADVIVSHVAVAHELGRVPELVPAIVRAHRANPGDVDLAALFHALCE
jgi:glycosyltransferase involved in cell wall biosynthesis